jgi:lipid II isoglutaminyl synthase (glutamine-hydrolysing)
LRESLNHDGDRLVHNADGANLHHGLASAHSSRPEAEIAILETDERVVGDVSRLGGPEVLVLLNFSATNSTGTTKSKGWVAAGARHWLTRARQDLSSSPMQTSH